MTSAVDEARYAELLRERHPHVIRTDAENDAALLDIEALMARGESISPEESELLALRVALVENYEDQHYALPRATPIEAVRELMAARGLRQRDIVALFPSKGVASEVLAGKRAISKSQAKRLAEYFGVSSALFI
jgi:HTH-type transcriptional regulator / antitoxin HigA